MILGRPNFATYDNLMTKNL